MFTGNTYVKWWFALYCINVSITVRSTSDIQLTFAIYFMFLGSTETPTIQGKLKPFT